MATKSDYYDILGVSKNASADEIKKAYRKQALQWHPDRHKDEKVEAERRFKEINEAYQVLSDPQKKSAYDQFGHQAFAPGGGFSNAGGFGGSPFGQSGQWGPFTYTYTTRGGGGGASPFAGFDFGDPFDIFEQFFGFGSPGRQPRKPRYSIALSFMEAAKGVEKTIEIEGKTRKIKLPAGVDEGSRIEFENFILSVNVRPDELFERDGEDVYIKVDVPYSLAVLGGDFKVPSIDGDVKIRIRAGTQIGTMIRLRGKGIQRLRGHGKGDEYVKIGVVVPQNLDRNQKDIIKALEDEGL